jgi:RmlD substrate binding domain
VVELNVAVIEVPDRIRGRGPRQKSKYRIAEWYRVPADPLFDRLCLRRHEGGRLPRIRRDEPFIRSRRHRPRVHRRSFAPRGLFYMTNSGQTTWYDYATTIFSLVPDASRKLKKLEATTTAEYPLPPAGRPIRS